MGYMTDGLTFNTLRGGNKARLPHFKNKHGQLAHSKPDGSDWTPAQWLQAVVGELGEYANLRKKYERGDLTAAEFEAEARKELADVQCYLDILALRCLDTLECAHPTGVDLGQAIMDKFNEISEHVGSSVRLAADDWHYAQDMPAADLKKPARIVYKGSPRDLDELMLRLAAKPGNVVLESEIPAHLRDAVRQFAADRSKPAANWAIYATDLGFYWKLYYPQSDFPHTTIFIHD